MNTLDLTYEFISGFLRTPFVEAISFLSIVVCLYISMNLEKFIKISLSTPKVSEVILQNSVLQTADNIHALKVQPATPINLEKLESKVVSPEFSGALDEAKFSQVIASPGSITPRTVFKAEAYILTKEEGGRHTPLFVNYRPQFYFRTIDMTGMVKPPDIMEPDIMEMMMPGDDESMELTPIAPVAMDGGLPGGGTQSKEIVWSNLGKAPGLDVINVFKDTAEIYSGDSGYDLDIYSTVLLRHSNKNTMASFSTGSSRLN